ncbi:unnamed protein product [Allacma fusca]|uniref:Uncharacterized protein n=1 Tax=Allacma fusca TaxID=39272 RepID=A0A8J2L6C9_9HEXA|nr:unnamed protein product [Allacma fusca]
MSSLGIVKRKLFAVVSFDTKETSVVPITWLTPDKLNCHWQDVSGPSLLKLMTSKFRSEKYVETPVLKSKDNSGLSNLLVKGGPCKDGNNLVITNMKEATPKREKLLIIVATCLCNYQNKESLKIHF